ncbi:hypothetical protein ACQPZJ_15225 [Actinoplanes sp. CA-054009]
MFHDGLVFPQPTSFCQTILDGRMPTVIPDVTRLGEGVETAEDAVTLPGLGVSLGQGWHFGRAVAAEELRETYGAMAPV